jgi:hypothetical protein
MGACDHQRHPLSSTAAAGLQPVVCKAVPQSKHASLWTLPQPPLILECQINVSEVIVCGEEPNDSN